MALQRRGVKFFTVVATVQAVFVVLIGVFAKYPDQNEQLQTSSYYPNFIDSHMIIFFAFSCLLAFLKHYAFSAIGFLFFIGAVCLQWTAIVRGFIYHDILGGQRFPLGVSEMLACDFSTATVLISYCVVLGKTSALQLLIMALCEIVVAQVTGYIGFQVLHVSDIGESMFIHVFGAYFGLAVSRALYDEDVNKSDKEVTVYGSDIICLIGTLALWVYWPTFNGGGAGEFQGRAFLHTYLSLAACTSAVFAFSALFSKSGKFEMAHIQNCTLAGGVAVGAPCNMPIQPFGAMLSGITAGFLCLLGFKHVTPFMAKKLKIHDTCGVHNLHGFPALLAVSVSIIMAFRSDEWDQEEQYIIFPAKAPANMSHVYPWAEGRSAQSQAGYQALGLLMTIGVSIVSGMCVGFLMKLRVWEAPRGSHLFDDVCNWEFSDDVDGGVANGKADHYFTGQTETATHIETLLGPNLAIKNS